MTDLVDDEHIAGSMPAAAADRDAARTAYYQQLAATSRWRPTKARRTTEQEPLDFETGARHE